MMIRAAVVGDARTLAGLNSVVHEPHVAARPDQFRPVRPDEVAAWFAALLGRPSARIWLAEEGAAPVGYILAFLHERAETPFCPARRWCEIDQIAVNAERRRTGIGRALVEQVLAWASAQGVSHVELTAWSFNAAAQTFRDFGFVPKMVRYELVLPLP